MANQEEVRDVYGYFEQKGNALCYRYEAERVRIEPWGADSLRVRAWKTAEMDPADWALIKPEKEITPEIEVREDGATIRNGKIRAEINLIGKIAFYNQKGELLLDEYVRNRKDMFGNTCSSLEVAREYKRRNLPISVIVVDFFHWPMQGEWKFDPTYWPDPDAMIKELKDMGIELMVSIWPTVDYRSENFNEMKSKGLLIRVDSGYPISMDFQGNTLHYDATNPEAREYVWEKAKKNYYDKGVKVFWLDEAEPEYTVYDFENYRYHLGPDIQVGNIYPVMYAKTFFDGMKAEGQENIINLLRCAWAGSQKYGALVWSGDIKSSFPSMKNQVAAGLNMGIAGIPWWTTDIGGFFGANINDPEFHELLVRWFEYGCFCPVMRLHGYRWPLQPQYGTTGGATCVSGAPNEVWSYTDQVCEILSDYLRLRERMLPYITELMEEAHEKGTPVMRPLFYDFPEDKESWNVETEYMFGPKVLVKPITDADARETDVYLPGGASWTNAWTGETFEGGQKVHVAAPIEQIPLFTRDGYKLPMK